MTLKNYSMTIRRYFSYDLDKIRRHLMAGEELTPFDRGLEKHLRWLKGHREGRAESPADFAIFFTGRNTA